MIVAGDVDKLTANTAAEAGVGKSRGREGVCGGYDEDTADGGRCAITRENAPAASEGIVVRDLYRHEGTVTDMHPTE